MESSWKHFAEWNVTMFPILSVAFLTSYLLGGRMIGVSGLLGLMMAESGAVLLLAMPQFVREAYHTVWINRSVDPTKTLAFLEEVMSFLFLLLLVWTLVVVL